VSLIHDSIKFHLVILAVFCRPSVGGQTFSVTVSGLPTNLAPSAIRIEFRLPQGAVAVPSASLVNFIGPRSASITFLTPSVDLQGAPSLITNMTVISNISGASLSVFQYVYTLVMPSVAAFSPKRVSDSGGDTVYVSLTAFPYPTSAIAMQYGDSGAFLPASVDATSSGPTVTFASFVAPMAPSGAASAGSITVRLFPAGCAYPCIAGSVAFTLSIFASTAPVLVDSGPIAAPWQRLMAQGTFPEVRVGNLPSGITLNGLYGNVAVDGATVLIAVNCSRIITRADGTVSLWLAFPPALAVPSALTVTVVAITGLGMRLKCTPYSLELYDAAQLRVGGLVPSEVATALYLAGRRLDIRPKASFCVSLLPPPPPPGSCLLYSLQRLFLCVSFMNHSHRYEEIPQYL
jgi:hypothetical protein